MCAIPLRFHNLVYDPNATRGGGKGKMAAAEITGKLFQIINNKKICNNNNNDLFDQKIHSKQNTLYALSVKNVISQEMEKR